MPNKQIRVALIAGVAAAALALLAAFYGGYALGYVHGYEQGWAWHPAAHGPVTREQLELMNELRKLNERQERLRAH